MDYSKKGVEVSRSIKIRLSQLGVNVACTDVRVNPSVRAIAVALIPVGKTTIRAIEARSGDMCAVAGARSCVTYRAGSHVIADLHWRDGAAPRPRPSYDALEKFAVEPMQFILGTDNGAPVRRRFGDAMPHMAIVGPSRYGKSSMAACVIMTLLRSTPNVRFVLCDPDINNPRTPALYPRIKQNVIGMPAVTPDAIDAALANVSGNLDQRRDWPVVVIVDELPRVFKSRMSRDAIENIVNRGAKAGVHALFISQKWGEDGITGNWTLSVSVVAGYSGHAGAAYQWVGVGASGAEKLSSREFVVRKTGGFALVDAVDMSWMGKMGDVPQVDIPSPAQKPAVISAAAPDVIDAAAIPKDVAGLIAALDQRGKVEALRKMNVPKSTIAEVVFGSRTASARKMVDSIIKDMGA